MFPTRSLSAPAFGRPGFLVAFRPLFKSSKQVLPLGQNEGTPHFSEALVNTSKDTKKQVSLPTGSWQPGALAPG